MSKTQEPGITKIDNVSEWKKKKAPAFCKKNMVLFLT